MRMRRKSYKERTLMMKTFIRMRMEKDMISRN